MPHGDVRARSIARTIDSLGEGRDRGRRRVAAKAELGEVAARTARAKTARRSAHDQRRIATLRHLSCVGNGLFFETDHGARYGFFHPPVNTPRGHGVLFVHGCFEERQDAHLVLKDAAERLAMRGHAAMRFDLHGHGDSDGEFREATLRRWALDTVAAARTLRGLASCRSVSVVGLRLGAIVATRAAATDMLANEIRRLVLWAPVVSGPAHLMDTLRAYLTSEMVVHKRATTSREALVEKLRRGETVNVFGYPLAPPLFSDLMEADLAADLSRTTCPALVVDVVRAAGVKPSAELESLAARWPARVRVERAVESQPLHAEGRYFMNRADAVFDRTANFLDEAA